MKHTLTLFKNKHFALIITLLALFAGSCNTSKPTLHVYTWADYIKPELIARFEEENNCKVVIDTFDSNESMYAKLNAGATGYDIITPTTYMVTLMRQQGMLLPLDQTKIPNSKNIDPDFLALSDDPSMKYSVMYACTFGGLAYSKSKVTDFQPTWNMLAKPDYKGRVTMLNDMRETVGAALKALGYSLNSTNDAELAAAKDLLVKWKDNLAKYESEQYKTGIASGEFLLVHGYNGDIMQVMAENDDVAFALPQEGVSIGCDELVIPKSSQQADLALKFINFVQNPAVAAENAEFIMTLVPNKASYEKLSAETRENPAIFLPAEIRAKSEFIKDLGSDNAKYIKVWDELKGAE